MARQLVRLKLSLMAGAWRRGVAYGLLQVFGIVMALSTATVGVLLAVVAAEVGAGRTVAASVAALCWAVGPVIGVGLDETLDPAKLGLLPLERRRLVTGLAAASVVGPGGVATLLPLLAFGVLGVPGAPVALLGVVAAVAQLAVCVLLARAIATSVARLLHTRRGRDAIAVTAGLSGLLLAGLGQLPRLLFDSGLDAGDLQRVGGTAGGVLRWVPTSWSMAAVDAAVDGQWLLAAAFAAGTGVLLAGLRRWWGRVLHNSLERAREGASARTRSGPLIGGMTGWLPPTPTGAAAARELRYAVAAPQRRIGTILLVLAAVGPPIAVVVLPALQVPVAMLFALAPAVFGMLLALNLFQADGLAIWQLLVVPGGGPTELRGKVLGQLVTTMPLVAGSAVALAVGTGSWALLPVVVAGGLVVLLVGTAVGQVSSVLVPMPRPDSPTNAFAAGSGAGCLQAVATTFAMVVMGVALLPPALGIGLTVQRGPAAYGMATALSVAYAAGTWVLGHRLASRLLVEAPDRFLGRMEAAAP